MSLINYGNFLNINEDDIKNYLQSKKLMNKSFRSKSNVIMLHLTIALILNKEPYGLIDRDYKCLFTNKLDNIIGVLVPIYNDKICKICQKNNASYEHYLQMNYYIVNKPRVCDDCLHACCEFATNDIIDLSLPIIFNRYCLFKYTSIYINLIKDINNYIFYLSIQ